jgi:hypothetical protein
MTPKYPTHCQICARSICAATGQIAHHGYKRPGRGWQTASCFGARYQPYEVACDAIPHAIEAIDRFVVRTQSRIENPPLEIVEYGHGYRSREIRYRLQRPEDFDTSAPSPGCYSPGGRDHYHCNFQGQVKSLRRDIESANDERLFLVQRLRDWKPAQEAA